MTEQESIHLLTDRPRFRREPGLAVMRSLLAALGHPERKTAFVHVAGTNGKGTICTLLDSVFRAQGLKTGLYTSPHVMSFRERMRIDGEMIPPDALAQAALALEAAAKTAEAETGLPVTEFEAITAAALWWFAHSGCDVVVLEVGMGGRFDATNAIPTPLAAVIASVSLDHTAVLGDTVGQIAYEKAGIIKPDGDAILYMPQAEETMETIRRVAREQNARLYPADGNNLRVLESGLSGSRLLWRDLPLFLPFAGEHQVRNAAAVLKTIEVLRGKGFAVSDEAVQSGFARAFIPARMEFFPGSPPVLLDGGHNPACAQALAAVVRQYFDGKTVAAVLGILAEKDSHRVLEILAPCFEAVFAVAPDSPRALPAEELARQAEEVGFSRVFAQENFWQALKNARDFCGPDGAVVVCGSFYLAGEARSVLLKEKSNENEVSSD